jgi:phage shock protein A
VRRTEIDAGKRAGTTSEDAAEIKRLKRENAELRRANAILKAASTFFAAELVTLARSVADQITRHAQHAAESSAATDALMLLDSRVHHAGQQVTRADEGVSMMRSGSRAHSRGREPQRRSPGR